MKRAQAATLSAMLSAIACGAPPAPEVAHSDPARAEAPRSAISVVVDAGAVDASEAHDDEASEAHDDEAVEARVNAESERAFALAEHGDFKQAEQILRAAVAEAEKKPVQYVAIGVRRDLLWLRWLDGDPRGAVADAAASAADVEASRVMGNLSVLLYEQATHDRAFMLRELLASAPAEDRTSAWVAANAARDEFAESAGGIGDLHAIAGLSAFFAVRAGDRAAALEATKRAEWSAPPFGNEPQASDLYAIALAYDLTGQHAKAAALRKDITPSDFPSLAIRRMLDAGAGTRPKR